MNQFHSVGKLALSAAMAFHAAVAWSAQDNASNAPYADGWQAGDNGGAGFGPWSFGFSGEAAQLVHAGPAFIDNGPLAGDALGNPTFALTTGDRPFFFDTSEAVRPLSVPMQIGKTFRVDVDGSALDPAAPGFSIGNTVRLRDAANNERFALFTNNQFNNDNWTAGDVDTGIPAANAFHVEFTLTGINTYNLALSPVGGGAPLYSVAGATLGGNAGAAITSLQFSAYGTGSSADGSKELFFDNVVVTPEPSSLAIGVFAAGRRRTRSADAGPPLVDKLICANVRT